MHITAPFYAHFIPYSVTKTWTTLPGQRVEAALLLEGNSLQHGSSVEECHDPGFGRFSEDEFRRQQSRRNLSD